MPTYDQLDNEAAWRDEHAAPALQTLTNRLRLHWPGAEIGIRGDNKHLSGYHRSRRWIKESVFCTNRSYSVSRTTGDRSGGDPNWSCAMDFGGIPRSELHAVCKRLDVAVRAGHLEKITQWYGNFGDDDRVDGWDNISNRIASSDSSHLTHLHLSFDRGRANDDHSDLLAVLTGVDMQSEGERNVGYMIQNGLVGVEEPVLHIPAENDHPALTWPNPFAEVMKALVEGRDAKIPAFALIPARTWVNGTAPRLTAIEAKLDQLSMPAPAPVDIAALVAALRPELDAAAERAVRKVLGAMGDHAPVP